jgi:AcrR family transcriptional regulator
MRAIAREAGVDPSLPRHYFASKSALFVEALGPMGQLDERVHVITSGNPESIGENIVRTFLALWDSPEFGPRLRILLTTAATTPEIGEVLKLVLFHGLFVRIARATGVDDASDRASAVASQMMGLALARYVLKLEPVASAPPEAIVARFGPAVQVLVTGDAPRTTA